MSQPKSVAAKIAQYLLEIGAIKLQPSNPFTWSSGWRSPIYCDNRVSLSFPEVRDFLKKSMATGIREQFGTGISLCGVATAGIAIGALVADEMGVPFAYCRPKPKEHGMQNQLEGRLDPSVPVVVIEDLISTGGSSLKVVEYLRNTGYDVQGMAAIFTYGFDLAHQNFSDQNCPYIALSDYMHLLPMALEAGVVSESNLQALENWRADPANWMQ